MSIRVISAVLDNAPYSGGELLVLIALADWADDNGRCWPSIPAIAQKARLQERQVYNVLRQLKADGILLCESGGGRGRSTSYVINTAMIAGNTAQKTVQPIAVKPCNPVQQNPATQCKSPTPPYRKNRQGTVKEPPKAKAKAVRKEIVTAVATVCTACGFTSAELGNILADQIALGLDRGKTLESLAADMIASWTLYQDETQWLRYTCGPPKFFGEGHWRNQDAWPYDMERLHRARQAAVGARR